MNTENEIESLKAKIAILEEENSALSQNSEDILLINVLFDSFYKHDSSIVLLEGILEKLSILKNIPFSAFFRISESFADIITGYALFQDGSFRNLSFKAEEDLIQNFNNPGYTFSRAAIIEIAVQLGIKNDSFIPNEMALFPFQNRMTGPIALLLMDNDSSGTRLSRMRGSIEQIVINISEKMDKVSLIDEVRGLNNELEKKVEERTNQLLLSIERLAENENKFKQLFENASDAIYVHGMDENGYPTNFTEVNRVGYERLGYTREEILKMSPKDIDAPEGRALIPAMMQLLIKDNHALWEGIQQTKKGEKLEVEISNHLFELNGHKTILATVRDVSSRKRIEEKIRMLAYALESVSECVTITDNNNNIIYANKSFAETYGYSTAELIGQNISIVRPESGYDAEQEKIRSKTLRGGWSGELINVKKNGSHFPVFLSTSLVKDDAGKSVALIGVARDITDIKNAHEELIAAKEKAEKANKLKTEFLAQMSHEIRSPLHIILGFLGIVKDENSKRLKKKSFKDFDGIDKAAKRILRTIDLILNMSQIQIGTYDGVICNIDLVDEILIEMYSEYYQTAKQKGLTVRLVNKTEHAPIRGDRYSIIQIFANLLDNAIKYTDYGGIEIVIENISDTVVAASVIDTGIGMSEEYMENIFEPFSQEQQGYTRKYEGTGLGMALVKKYVEYNNANITVSSQVGCGSVFRVEFNRIQEFS